MYDDHSSNDHGVDDHRQRFDGLAMVLDLNVSSSAGEGSYPIEYFAYASPGPPNPEVIAASPATLQFPATVFGKPSAPKTVTVTNVSSRTLTIAIPSISDFIVEPSCTQLLPGASCEAQVRYVPTSGIQQAAGSVIVTATDVADPTGLTAVQSEQTIATTGSNIPQASLASPAFAGLVADISVDSSVSLNVTNTSAAPLTTQISRLIINVPRCWCRKPAAGRGLQLPARFS